MDREQIIKALEWRNTAKRCIDYPYRESDCDTLYPNALSLIKELTEENERLAKHNAVLIEDNHILATEFKEITIADTVRKMQELIKERCIKGGIYPAFVARTIDQIAKEMLEEEK